MQYRFAFFNLLLAGYLWFVQPALLLRMRQPELTGQPDPWMGWLLLSVQVFELAGFFLKGPVNAYLVKQSPTPTERNPWVESYRIVTLVMAPVLHLAFSSILALIAYQMLVPLASPAMDWLPVVLIFIVIIKEAFFIAALLSTSLGSLLSLPQNTSDLELRLRRLFFPRQIDQITLSEAIKDLAGDLILLAFSALSYTAAWELLTVEFPLRAGSSGMFNQYLGASFLYWMVYFGSRAAYLMQEIAFTQTRRQRIVSWISFMIAWISALQLVSVK